MVAAAANSSPPETAQAAPGAKLNLVRRSLARIPGTPAFGSRKNGFVADKQKALLEKLREIFPAISGEAPRIRFDDEGLKTLFITEVAQFEFWSEEMRGWLLWTALAAPLPITLAGCIIARRIWHIREPGHVWGAASVAACFLLGISVICIAVGGTISENHFKWSSKATQIFVVLAPPALFATVCLILAHYLRVAFMHPSLTFALSAAAFVSTLFVLSFAVLIVALLLVQQTIERQTWETRPVTFIFSGLLDLLPLQTWSFQDPYWTAQFLSSLERVAYLMEGPLVRRLRPADPATQSWLEQEMKGHAAAVRELKKIAIYSAGVKPPRLRDSLETTLMHVCNLDWEQLTKAAVPVVSKRERARRFSQRLVNAATASVVPTGILIARLFVPAIQQFDKTNLVLVGTIIWLCINLLSAFDPEYGLTKQGLDLLSKIPGVGGKGGGTPSGAEH